MTDEPEGGWDKPEDLEPRETLTTTGVGWDWVPPWKHQNPYGADRRLWRGGRPPVTQRLTEHLHPYEVAHFEDSTFRQRLLDFTARKMLKRRVEGVEPEDMVSEVVLEMERVRVREGFAVGSPDWMRVAQVVTSRRITDALRRMGGRVREGDERSKRRTALMYGEYIAARKSRPFESTDPEDDAVDQDPLTNLVGRDPVPQVFSDEYRKILQMALTPREYIAVLCTYEDDLSGEQTAEKMQCSPSTVRVLLYTARESLSKHFSDIRR